MIRVDTAAASRTPKGSGGGGGGGYNGNINITKTGVQGVYLWGHYHDHNADITGDLDYVGNINASGKIYTSGDIEATNAKINGDIEIGGELKVNDINCNELRSNSIVNQGTIITKEMKAVSAYIKDLIGESIAVDNLTVTKAAHFFKLIIDEIKSAQGVFVLSVGNTNIDEVGHPSETKYRCYFRAKDPDTGEKIFNMFEQYDQVVCQTFNQATTGVTYDVSNKWYWMLASSTGTTTTVPIESESVREILNTHFDTDNSGLLSVDEFNAISDISTYFASSAVTGNFNELGAMSSVTALANGAFENSNLNQITLPESLRTIGNGAFKDCSVLSYIEIPTQLASIGNEVFKNCRYLEEIIILRGTIGSNCFNGCESLTYLQLPEGMTEINKNTLNGCYSIQTLVVPSTVSSITSDSFDELYDLRRVYFKSDTPPTVSAVTEDDIYLFEKNSVLTTIYIPSGTTSGYTAGLLYPSQTHLVEYQYDEMGTGVQQSPVTEDYHYVELTTEDKDPYSNSVPEKGDSIAVLGNRYNEDRQNALMLGAYNIAWLDPEIRAPFMSQYAGINNYNLKSHRLNVISNGKNEFFGQFKVVVSGNTKDLDEYISENSGLEIVTDSDAVYFMTDREGYITSLHSVKGLPTRIQVKMGKNIIPVMEWDNGSYIKFNGNNAEPLRSGKEE